MMEGKISKVGQISESFSKEIINKMVYFYEDQQENSPQGAVFRARTDNAVITAYQSGKVLFQGKNPAEEAAIWTTMSDINNTKQARKKQKEETIYTPPAHLFTSNHIGSDESGTGDYFGPVTACAVYVTADQITPLKKMGIQDSKTIDDVKIRELAKQLSAMQIPYSSMVIPNEKYNQLQEGGWTQGKMKTMIHQAVIQSLLEKIGEAPSEGILIDQFCQPAVFVDHLRKEGKALAAQTFFMTKAETYSIAVAAASVLARYRFITEMDRLSDKIGMPILKGASKKVDQQIATIIREHGEDILPSIAKLHFANTRKAAQYL